MGNILVKSQTSDYGIYTLTTTSIDTTITSDISNGDITDVSSGNKSYGIWLGQSSTVNTNSLTITSWTNIT